MRKDVAIVSSIVLFIAIGLFLRSSSMPASEDAQTNTNLEVQNTKVENKQEGGDVLMADAKAPAMQIDENAQYTAVIKTNKGDITVDLTTQDTPVTVNNFVSLARDGFYDGTIFHRVIKDFMIQGGDPDGNGTGGPGYTFADEFTPMEFDGPGYLAMANRGPDTNGSQFFITHAATPWLNGDHTIFGKVTEGMDVVDAIANVEVGAQDKPVQDVVVETIQINEEK